MILSVDLLAILSFDSLPRDLAALVDSHEIYVIFEEWYSYIGYFFSMCFFLLLLACMCAVFLMNSSCFADLVLLLGIAELLG